MKRTIVAFMVVISSLLILAGCAATNTNTATTGGQETKATTDGQETKTTSDRQRTQKEGAGMGALIGGLLGAVAGQAIGNDTEATILGAVIGAGLGGASGYAYGTHVANQKEKYAKEEDWLDACIASVSTVNNETQQYNEALVIEISELDTQANQLLAQYQQKKVKKKLLAKEKAVIDAKMAEAEEKLKRAKFELENQETVLAEAKQEDTTYVNELTGEVNRLKGLIAELEGHTESLASMSLRMAV